MVRPHYRQGGNCLGRVINDVRYRGKGSYGFLAIAHLDYDKAVNEVTKRSRTATAMSLVENQTARRNELVAERARAADVLATVEVEGAGIANARP
jgi:hypothetical protein